VLYSFCSQTNCADGAQPVAGLIMDGAGNLYGTTQGGGNASGQGVVFQLRRHHQHRGTAWTETVLYSFCSQTDCADGARPSAGLTIDGAGNLYGTTGIGGNGRGVVFELTPDQTPTAWTETVLYRFCAQSNCADGAYPEAGLIMDGAGNLYGTTAFGGIGGAGGGGVVFELTPGQTGTAWTETMLYSFCAQTNCADGEFPYAGLIMDGAGNLYGTTYYGGGRGVVFQLTPDETGAAWTETVLYRFCSHTNCPDGAYPEAGLIMDGTGNLYGTTVIGGNGSGVVFALNASLTARGQGARQK
jgi:uncharacterized repeat protein (TIGR03803 family)